MAGVGSGAVLLWAGTATLAMVAVGVWLRIWATRRRPGSAPAAADLTAYEVAYLSGGRRRVAETALAYLTWAGIIEVREGVKKVAMTAPPGPETRLQPVDRALVNSLTPQGSGLALPMSAARAAADGMDGDLDGLCVTEKDVAFFRFVGAAPLLAVAAMSVWWIAARLDSDQPVGLLWLIPLLAVVAATWNLAFPPRRTQAGQLALHKVERMYQGEADLASVGVTSVPVEAAMYLIALHGTDLYTGSLLPLRRVLLDH